jgi:hypothetical protein
MTRALEVLAGRVEATLRASNVPWCVPDEPRCLLPYSHEGALLGLRSCRAKILGFTFRCSEDADQNNVVISVTFVDGFEHCHLRPRDASSFARKILMLETGSRSHKYAAHNP